MMQLFKKSSWREKAQTMIEFALVFPVLLLLLYGIIEFGRLLFIYTSVTTSSREAARYGSAVGNTGGIPRYLDCAGILGAGRRSAILTPLDAGNITISYDHGPSVPWYPSSITCATASNEKFVLGDRIVVDVSVQYTPLMPLVNFASFPISSTTARTILRTVEVLGTPVPNPAQPYVYFEVTSQSGTETELDTDAKVIYAVLSSAYSYNVTAFFTYGGTATRDEDYTGVDSLVFTPGQTRLAVARVKNDQIDEWDETLVITIPLASEATIDESRKTHTTTIVDDDPPPVVQFEFAQQTVDEGQAVEVKAKLSQISGKDVTVPYTYDGTAIYGTDYALNPATLSFVFPAMSGTEQKVNLLAAHDGMYGDDKHALLTLSEPTPPNDTYTLGAPKIDDILINNIDPKPHVSFDLDSQTVIRGITAKLLVVLDNKSTKPVIVDYTATDLEAKLGIDYAVDPPNQVTIPAGSTEAEISLEIKPLSDPDIIMPDMRFEINMTNVVDADKEEPTKHTVTISGIKTQPVVNFEASKSAKEDAGAVKIRFLLDHAWNQIVTVPYFIKGGTAANGSDYTASVGSVTIPIGRVYGTFTVNLIDDTLYEDNETIIFGMGTPTYATPGSNTEHVLTIADNDLAPLVSFELASQLGMENGGPMTVTVQLSEISARTVSVPFIDSGTATRGTDYTVSPSPVSIPPGSTSAVIVINVIDDTVPGENYETVILTMGAPTNAQLGAQPVHTATIKDNDLCPILSTRDIQPGSGKNWIVMGMLYTDLTQPTIWITEVNIDWNNGLGEKLLRVEWMGIPIWQDPLGTSTAPLNLTTFSVPQSSLTFAPIEKEQLLVVYFNNPIVGTPDQYGISVTFNNQCRVP